MDSLASRASSYHPLWDPFGIRFPLLARVFTTCFPRCRGTPFLFRSFTPVVIEATCVQVARNNARRLIRAISTNRHFFTATERTSQRGEEGLLGKTREVIFLPRPRRFNDFTIISQLRRMFTFVRLLVIRKRFLPSPISLFLSLPLAPNFSIEILHECDAQVRALINVFFFFNERTKRPFRRRQTVNISHFLQHTRVGRKEKWRRIASGCFTNSCA